MNFNTITASFPHDENGKYQGRITHFAQFVNGTAHITLPHEEDFLGLFINLGKAQHYKLGNTADKVDTYHYNLVYLPKGSCTFIQENGFYSWLTIHYTLDYFLQLAENIRPVQQFLKDFDPTVPRTINAEHRQAPFVIKDVVHDMNRNTLRGPARATYLRFKSLAMLIACLDRCDYAEEEILSEDIEKVRQVYDYITKNLSYRRPISELAGKVKLSDRKFKHVFQAVYGKRVQDVIIDERIKYAKELLTETGKALKEIALIVGYGSAPAFMDAFRRETGFYPKEYREKFRNTPPPLNG